VRARRDPVRRDRVGWPDAVRPCARLGGTDPCCICRRQASRRSDSADRRLPHHSDLNNSHASEKVRRPVSGPFARSRALASLVS
jgi:hypothetical protein